MGTESSLNEGLGASLKLGLAAGLDRGAIGGVSTLGTMRGGPGNFF
jgi:hypothetical protein